MKTAISLPDKLFSVAEKYAKTHGLSRSKLYAMAIREYIKNNRQNNITEQINIVCETIDTSLDPQIKTASKRVLAGAKW